MWGYDDKESIDTKKKNIDQSVQELLTILISQSGRGKACEAGGPAPPHLLTLHIPIRREVRPEKGCWKRNCDAV